MKRVLAAALFAAALLGCGGDEVNFDLDSPPQWLKNLDQKLPAKQLNRGEVSGNCIGTQFARCDALVQPSKSMTRKGKFELRQGSEVRITYTPAGGGNPVTMTLRPDKPATVPVRKTGGTLLFRCRSVDRCTVDMM